MLKLRKVAVTGGLSCGKSSVCRFFKKFGSYTVSADEIVHQLLSPVTTIGQNIIKLFGNDIIINNQIDRSKIAQKVFNQPALLNSLERILHPAVQQEIVKHYEQAIKLGQAKLFVAEIPLLFEAGTENFYDVVITVIAKPDISEKRFQKATGYDTAEFEKRSSRQMSLEEKAERADYIIENNGSLEELEVNTKKIMNILTT